MVSLPIDPPSGKQSLATAPVSTPAAASSPPAAKNYSFALSTLDGHAFSPRKFIRDHRPHAPLSVLRDDLRTHVASLQGQIVHELQADFYHFIYPPVSLADLPALAAALSPSLHALRARLHALHEELGAQAESLRAELSSHHDLLSRRAHLAALLSAHDGLAKLERLLAGPPPTSPAANAADPLAPQKLAHLHRVASETAKLSFVVARAPNGPFLRSLAPRVSAVTRAARTALDDVLHPALARLPADTAALARVLALFLAAAQPDAALDSFSRAVVAPFAASLRMSPMLALAEKDVSASSAPRPGAPTIATASGAPAAGAKPIAPAPTPAHALRAAQRAISAFLADRVAPVVAVVASTPDLAPHLDIVGAAVWPALQRALARQMAPAFSPGLPDVFHASFLAGQDILQAVYAATDARFRPDFVQSPATADFRRAWNLPVYFQLRFQEIASVFEQHLEAGPLARRPRAAERAPNDAAATSESHLLRSDVYAADASAALVVALRRCWLPAVFLRALTHRFVRLALQLLARYATWVRVGLAGAWPDAEDSSADGVARIARDVATLQRRLPAELASILRARLAGPRDGAADRGAGGAAAAAEEAGRCDDDDDDEGEEEGENSVVIDEVEAAFVQAVDALAAVMPDLLRAIADALARKCVANLQPLRGILATYRMSSKQAPTTHSSFVPKILRPLRSFLRDHDAALAADDRAHVAARVAETTAKEYCAMATDLLQRNKSSEATLRRLNIGRGGPAAAAGGAVVEKIATQLYLDVEKFGDELAAIGIDAERVPSLDSLRAMVRRERGEADADAVEATGGDAVEEQSADAGAQAVASSGDGDGSKRQKEEGEG